MTRTYCLIVIVIGLLRMPLSENHDLFSWHLRGWFAKNCSKMPVRFGFTARKKKKAGDNPKLQPSKPAALLVMTL